MDTMQPRDNAWQSLRRFAQPRPPVERCELCSLPLAAEHAHLLETATQRLLCACDACAILFSHRVDGRYRRVPREIRVLADFALSDAQWDALAVPIGMAFFYYSTPLGKMAAMYPSPAGAVQSLLDFDGWQDVVAENPVLQALEPDTEALLCNRIGSRREYYQVPIDECYRLAGLIRSTWRGLSGGARVWQEVDTFFDALKQRASKRMVTCPS